MPSSAPSSTAPAPGRDHVRYHLRLHHHRLGLRRQRLRLPACEQRVQSRGHRAGPALRDGRICQEQLEPLEVDLGAHVRHARHPLHHHLQRCRHLPRCRRRWRLARLRQHPPRALRRLLQRPPLEGARPRLARRTGPLLRRGPSHAGLPRAARHLRVRSGPQRGPRRHGDGRQLQEAHRRRLLRRARQGGRRPLLRWRRSGPHRLQLLRRLHDRLQRRRQELARQELPLPRREARRGGHPRHQGARRQATPRCNREARRLGRLRGRDRAHGLARLQPQDAPRQAGHLRCRRARHREAAR